MLIIQTKQTLFKCLNFEKKIFAQFEEKLIKKIKLHQFFTY